MLQVPQVPHKGSTLQLSRPKVFQLRVLHQPGVSSLAPIARGFRRLSLHQHWRQVAFWYQNLLVAPTGIWWHFGCSFKDLMADELGNEIRMLLGGMNGMSKPPSELGSWNALQRSMTSREGPSTAPSWILLWFPTSASMISSWTSKIRLLQRMQPSLQRHLLPPSRALFGYPIPMPSFLRRNNLLAYGQAAKCS